MSVYFARYGGRGTGLFDLASHIVVVPGELPTHLVVEHELAHVKLVQDSGLGLLEQFLRMLWNSATEANSLTALRTLHEFRKVFQKANLYVHESAAWYLTQMLQLQYPEIALSVPLAFQPDVARVRELFRSALGGRDEAAVGLDLAGVAEEAAIHALSPPALDRFWERPQELTADRLADVLAPPDQLPLARFRTLYRRLPELLGEAFPGGAEDPDLYRSANGLPRSTAYSGKPDNHLEVLEGFARGLGIDRALGPSWDPEFTLTFFHAFATYSTKVDRYAQVCALEPRGDELGQPPAELGFMVEPARNGALLVVTSAPGNPYDEAQNPVFDPADAVVRRFDFTTGEVDEKVVDRAQLRAFVARQQPLAPIAAMATDYNFQAADYRDALVGNRPHVVISISDFRYLWNRIAWFGHGGLHGSPVVEFHLMPSSRSDSYGFLLLKPQNQDWPIVVNPILIDQWRRVLSFAEIPGPFGVQLRQPSLPIPSWAGATLPSLTATLATVDRWFPSQRRPLEPWNQETGIAGWG